VRNYWAGVFRRIPDWGYVLAAVILIPIILAPLFVPTAAEATASQAKPNLLLSILLALHSALALPFLPIFAILKFFEDFVTFLFNQINGLILYVFDNNFAAVRAGAAAYCERIWKRTPLCQSNFSARISKINQTLVNLQNTE
jgi:hypothetical protein